MPLDFDVMEVVHQITKAKNLDQEYVLETIKEGLMTAAKKRFGEADNIKVHIDRREGEVYMVATKTVVAYVQDAQHEISLVEAQEIDEESEIGDEMEVELPFEEFGRNAIAATKQILVQRIREREREQIYAEYKDRIGEVVTGIVQHIDKGTIIVNLAGAEAVVPHKEQIPRERFRQGDRIRAYIADVQPNLKGPQIVLSRAHPGLLLRLFELEVPEIFEKIVEIKAVAREPGERSKVAVASIDDRVDPVGACVGVKGVRVQSVVRELANERIDIVPWDSDSETFVARALAPARVVQVKTDPESKAMTVIVDDDKLSLAIGRNGQNARLAAKLTGWKITIRSESQYLAQRSRVHETNTPLVELPGIGEVTKSRLEAVGIDSIETLAAKTAEELVEIEGIGPKTAGKLIEAAQEYVSQHVDMTVPIVAPSSRSTKGDELFEDVVGEDEPEPVEEEHHELEQLPPDAAAPKRRIKEKK
ncbi:MAG: transcription termination/antitermination protein NusA [candidate division Zixibacteria bacterium]|nr:transcription termination/antitermination protein NusA [candidate division Zixibacteria bacterium]